MFPAAAASTCGSLGTSAPQPSQLSLACHILTAGAATRTAHRVWPWDRVTACILIAERPHRLLHQFRHALIAPSRNPRMAVVIGRLLAIAFLLCFGTGLYSHFLQDPLPWMVFPTRPVWLYQVTQGIHITAGIACFPLIARQALRGLPRAVPEPAGAFVRALRRAGLDRPVRRGIARADHDRPAEHLPVLRALPVLVPPRPTMCSRSSSSAPSPSTSA